MRKPMSELSQLPNIGRVLEENLIDIGIETQEELRAMGAKEAFARISRKQPARLHMLYGIQGAIEGVRGVQLDAKTMRDLRSFYKTLSG